MNIFMTIGAASNDMHDPIFSLADSKKIQGFRFNLGKYNTKKDMQNRIRFINTVKKSFPLLEIMLDIPFPGRKIRIQIENDKMEIEKGEEIKLIFKQSQNKNLKGNMKSVYVLSSTFFKILKLKQLLIYSDGDGIFEVCSINIERMIVHVKALRTVTLYTGKTISANYIPRYDTLRQDLLEAVKEVKPDYLALSFVSNAMEIKKCQELFRDQNIKIISKIESAKGVENIEEIAKVSDIMLARGDLLLNIPIKKFPAVQETVAHVTNSYSKRLFCATGILKSIIQYGNMIPTQADIMDLYRLLMYNPYALILNYVENGSEACIWAIDIIQELNNSFNNKVRD